MWYILLLSIWCLLFALFIIAFLISRFGYVTCDNNVCLLGKTALVTGGSTGLGHEIVLSLASRGCRVIIAGRTINSALKNKIIEETNNPNIVLYHVDFTSFKSVRQLAKKLNETEEKLDILVNNSGIGKSLYTDRTEDGLDITMQINHYSPFLLTNLLAGLLKKSNNGRIIFTSSFLSFFHVITKRSVTPLKIKNLPQALYGLTYGNTKFLNIVSSDIFAEKLKKWNITSNVYNPLVAKTNIFNQVTKNVDYRILVDNIVNVISKMLVNLFGIDPKLSIQAAIQLATSKEYTNISGTFLGKVFPKLKPRACHDRILCEAIWRASEEVVQLTDEEKLK
ncbi:unnamed protein product [Psylliodes chrysocephalus]|uniref:Uncharacterized protein n=1 Tax=Psylliodes chrysocephalus TaxID=3402493 RepID=A0A9P0GD42_9CUCU|nr:unnamed protein product [Psylliodes chrysocephala]